MKQVTVKRMSPYLENLIRYAESFWGVPYLLGGNLRETGMDCSGFTCEVLRSVGVIGAFEDLSAQGLYDKFAAHTAQQVTTGGLCFYGTGLKSISHVALITSPYTVIESGGDPKKGGGVRNRSIAHRADLRAIIYPPYPWE